MLNKKILAAAIAATLSQSAFAVVDLDLATVVPAKYASETVAKKASKTTKGNSIIVDGGTNLSVDANVGFGFTANTSFYVRVDLTDAVFATALTDGDLVLTGSSTTVALSQGGGEDQAFVIYEVVDTDAVSVGANVQLTVADLGLTGTGDATVRFRVFANAPDAVGGTTGALVDKSGTYVDQVSALTTAFTAVSPVADVDQGFIDFTGNATIASLGTVKISLVAAFAADDGALVARADVMADASSTFVVTGDFSTALDDSDGEVTVEAGGCTGAGTALTVNETGTSATLTGTATFTNATSFSVCLEPDTETAIAATDAFSATLTPAAGTDGTYAAQTGALGSISRNGTTLEIPYITTFADYNQRLIMTNNAATATTYSCTFTPEAGVTATAGAMATGSIAANTTVVVKASDLVTITGGSRTAARCTLLSQSANIDSATTIVNLADKSTDTVTIN